MMQRTSLYSKYLRVPSYGIATMKTSLALVGLVLALIGGSGCTHHQLRPVHAPELVHPLCINELVSPAASPNQTASINLSQCQKKYGHLPFTTEPQYGVVWRRSETTNSEELPAYVAYKIVGQIGSQLTLIQFSANYNGSGLFSSALLLDGLNEQGLTDGRRTLTLQQNIVGGDRCNNGIENLLIESTSSFLMVRNKTLAGLLTPNDSDTLEFNSRSDLPDCAICCAGTTTERYTFTDHNQVNTQATPQYSVIFSPTQTQLRISKGDPADCVYSNLLNNPHYSTLLTPPQQLLLSKNFQNQCLLTQ